MEKFCDRLKPQVCFYTEFDETPIEIWKRIENGNHINEKNCPELLDVFKKLLKEKQRKSQESFPDERKKLISIEETNKDVESSLLEIGKNVTADEVKKYLELPQESMTPIDWHKIKVSIESFTPGNAPTTSKEVVKASSEIEKRDVDERPRTPNGKELSDLDLEELNFLIQNFENLSSEEQNNLISYLQKLEKEDQQKFQKLN